MRTEGDSLANTASALIPPVMCDHPDDVESVRAEENFRLRVRFHDGTGGVVDLGPLIHAADAGVFAALADPVLFAQASIELGAVTWPGGLDLAPDAMYQALREFGQWTPA